MSYSELVSFVGHIPVKGKVGTYTACRNTSSKVDGSRGGSSGRARGRSGHSSGGEDGERSVDTELHDGGVLCVVGC